MRSSCCRSLPCLVILLIASSCRSTSAFSVPSTSPPQPPSASRSKTATARNVASSSSPSSADSQTAEATESLKDISELGRGMGGRIEEAFASAKRRGEAAFVTFVTAGYPSKEGACCVSQVAQRLHSRRILRGVFSSVAVLSFLAPPFVPGGRRRRDGHFWDELRWALFLSLTAELLPPSYSLFLCTGRSRSSISSHLTLFEFEQTRPPSCWRCRGAARR